MQSLDLPGLLLFSMSQTFSRNNENDGFHTPELPAYLSVLCRAPCAGFLTPAVTRSSPKNNLDMFDLFKSAKQRKREEDYDAFLEAVSKSLSAAQSEIQTLESKVEPQLRRQAAVILKNALIYSDRTVEAVEELQLRAERLIAENHLGRAIGTSLGSRLVLCGVLLLKLESKEWLNGALAFAPLEGTLKGFVERYRVPSWPVNYVQDVDFETYRKQLIADEESADLEFNSDPRITS